jgi:uncharacterized protein YggU (UPF0235/DUF167 family)
VAGSAGDPPRLLVYVGEAAVDGKATAAALKAVAKAFGLKPADVSLISGITSRDKVVEIDGDDEAIAEQLQKLLNL